MTTHKDILQITEGLSNLFEEYAKLEFENGSYFNADVWKKAANIAKSYVGSWNRDIKVPEWKGSVRSVSETDKKNNHFGCIPIRVDDL